MPTRAGGGDGPCAEIGNLKAGNETEGNDVGKESIDPSTIEIDRDPYGIPHIWARTPEDAFFGQGYVHASDRWSQMERDRRQAYGTLAEVAGPIALADDRLSRQLRLRWVARRDYEALDSAARSMLAAYAAGVNAWIRRGEERRVRRGVVGQARSPWEPQDSLAVFLKRHLGMGRWETKLWRAYLAKSAGPREVARWYALSGLTETATLPPGHRSVTTAIPGAAELLRVLAELPPREGDSGSNNWVLSGHRTASGFPLLAGDPHRLLDVPGVYYQNHLASPVFDAIGFSMPGVPGLPHFGHSAEVAWGITHGMADTGDLFEIDTKDSVVVHADTERIRVRGASDVKVEVLWTEVGAVISGEGDGNRRLALCLPELCETNRTADAFVPMLRARTVAELDRAMRSWVAPVQNLVMADRSGTIGYRTRGRVPIRPRLNAFVPVPDRAGNRLTGYVPFEDMPHVVDPDQGFVATANNRVTQDDRVYISSEFAPEHRVRRIGERLASMARATVDDMVSVLADVVSPAAREAIELLGQVTPKSPLARDAKTVLEAWDGTMDAHLAAPLIYSAWREALVDRLLFGVLRPDDTLDPRVAVGRAAMAPMVRGRVIDLARTGNLEVLPASTTWPALLSEAFSSGVAYLKGLLGPDLAHWQWGDLHQLEPAGPSAGDGPFGFSLPGDPDTVRAASYLHGTGFRVQSGSVARYVFDLADWDQSGWVLPHGEGGEPGHAHFADQVTAWRELQLLPMPYSRRAVQDTMVSRTVIGTAFDRSTT